MDPARRLTVVRSHLLGRNVRPRVASGLANHHPSLTVTPSSCLVDEKIIIQINGLKPKQEVTLVAEVTENGNLFEARCLYQAGDNGEIDSRTSTSLKGSFQGVDQMGLFWSISPVEDPTTRFFKKDVSKPMDFRIRAYFGDLIRASHTQLSSVAVSEAHVMRTFMRPGIKRIPLSLTSGPVKGTVFIPEGDGPFPAIVDMYGAFVSLVETRAALLASHGYATLALCYLYAEGLPGKTRQTDFFYIKNAYEWFSRQPYVDANRLGAFGLCFGGFLALCTTAVVPQIKAVVNINGASHIKSVDDLEKPTSEKQWWTAAKPENVYTTDEGVTLVDVFDYDDEPAFVPAWRHGAKILIIVGEDDKQSHPKWHKRFYDDAPVRHRPQITIRRYEGTGHLIEPPFMPLVGVMNVGRKRLDTLEVIPDKYLDLPMVSGGFPKEHAHAREDSWKHILNFLNTTLRY